MAYQNFQNPYSFLAQQAYQNAGVPMPQVPQMVPQQMAQQSQMPQMTPPTIRAEIVQIDDDSVAANYPVNVGASIMLMTKDDSTIFIKSATPNGITIAAYDRRPPSPAPKQINPEDVVTWDALEAWMAERSGKKPAKKEVKQDEPV